MNFSQIKEAVERGVVQHFVDKEAIDWDSLTPICKAVDANEQPCCSAPGDVAAEYRHLQGACSNEGRVEFFCSRHYESFKKYALTCNNCDNPCHIYAL